MAPDGVRVISPAPRTSPMRPTPTVAPPSAAHVSPGASRVRTMPHPRNSAPLELPVEELLPYRSGHVELLVNPMHASPCPSVAPPDGTEAPTPAIRTYRRRVRTERDRNFD